MNTQVYTNLPPRELFGRDMQLGNYYYCIEANIITTELLHKVRDGAASSEVSHRQHPMWIYGEFDSHVAFLQPCTQ
jgi:hypothetical protein